MATQVELKQVNGGITAAKGIYAAGIFAGIKRKRKDLAVFYSEVPAAAAGVYTTNKVKAAPVLVCMDRIGKGPIQAVAVISGNANACTGERGLRDAYTVTEVLAAELGIDPKTVTATSTGVIGVPLPMERVKAGLKAAAGALSREGGKDAAEAIMTTDTTTKECAVELTLGGKTVRIGAMAKGSGMIHPNMATMLAFIATDLAIEKPLLDKALKEVVNDSFNCITVDGDTSTNDMVMIMANGLAGNDPIQSETPDFKAFSEALRYVCTDLAKKIVRDGEGASKLVEIHVRGAKTKEDAKAVAMAVARSSLVKTAIYGEDANWGRILCAVGYSGGDFDPAKVDLYIGCQKVAENGVGFDFDEGIVTEILRQSEIKITVDLKDGMHGARVWTCDLTYDYVKINASYRS